MRTVTILGVVLLCVLCGSVRAADGQGQIDYVGRPLVDVLEELREEGLKLVYSSDVVTPGMKVASAPKASRPGKILRELLAPHRLTTEAGPGGTILIVREATDERPAFSSIHGTIVDALTARLLQHPLDAARRALVVRLLEDAATQLPGDLTPARRARAVARTGLRVVASLNEFGLS